MKEKKKENEKLLKSSLFEKGILNQLIDDKKRFKILSIWKPGKRFHVVDILVARAFAALAEYNNECKLFFSSIFPQGFSLDIENQIRITRFCEHFYRDVFSLYTNKESIDVKSILPFEDEDFATLDTPYTVTLDYIKNNNKKIWDTKITKKGWPLKREYLFPLILTIIKNKPDYIFCGHKHKWIWEDLIFLILKNAKRKSPNIIYLSDFKGFDGKTFSEDQKDVLYTDLEYLDIVNLLKNKAVLKKSLKQNRIVIDILTFLCFSNNLPLIINDSKIVKYNELKDSSFDGENIIGPLAKIFSEAFHVFKRIYNEHSPILGLLPKFEISNRTMADLIGFTFSQKHNYFSDDEKSIWKINESPDIFRAAYQKTISEIYKSNFMKYKEVDEEIHHLLKKVESLDILLYLLKKRYRDHFSHQFNVFGLGIIFLRALAKDNSLLKFCISEKLNLEENLLEYAWALASLLHDHAYPLSYLLELQVPMTKLSEGEGNKNDIEKLNKTLNEIIPRVYDYLILPRDYKSLSDIKIIVEEFCKNFKINFDVISSIDDAFKQGSYYVDHGILSAVNIWLHLKKLPIEKLKNDYFPLYIALEAIALHNIDKKLSVEEKPLAVLLKICDEIHEWGRPLLVNGIYHCPILSITLNLIPKISQGNSHLYEIPEKVEIEFICSPRTVLNISKWDEKLFLKNKQEKLKNMKLFRKDGLISPKEIVLFVKVPSEIMGN